MSIIQQKDLFFSAEQTNDYFDSGNLQSELHKMKKQ